MSRTLVFYNNGASTSSDSFSLVANASATRTVRIQGANVLVSGNITINGASTGVPSKEIQHTAAIVPPPNFNSFNPLSTRSVRQLMGRGTISAEELFQSAFNAKCPPTHGEDVVEVTAEVSIRFQREVSANNIVVAGSSERPVETGMVE